MTWSKPPSARETTWSREQREYYWEQFDPNSISLFGQLVLTDADEVITSDGAKIMLRRFQW